MINDCLQRSIGSSPESLPSSLPEFDLFALVCASGKGDTEEGGRVDKKG